MNVTPSTGPSHGGLARFRILRNLFVFGYVLSILLIFTPFGTVQIKGKEEVHSTFSLLQQIPSDSDSAAATGARILITVLIALSITFIVLAFAHPRRWVFITASSVTAFSLLLSLTSGSAEGVVNPFLIPRILGWVSSAFILLGFLVRPPIAPKGLNQ